MISKMMLRRLNRKQKAEQNLAKTREVVTAALVAAAERDHLVIDPQEVDQLCDSVLRDGRREDIEGLLDMVRTLDRGDV